jgi:hypothetical protein
VSESNNGGAGSQSSPLVITRVFTATDAANNTASATQTVTVADTTAPTVSAPAPTSAPANDSCQAAIPNVIPGSSGSDNCGGTVALTQSPAAGTAVGLGPHTITVTGTDAAGNSGQATTSFTVNDTTPPAITLNGATSLTVECHGTFTDPGATASDNCSGNVSVNASGSVNVNTPGTYTITYNAHDAAGNAAAPKTRTVKVVDTTPPTISCPSNIVVTLPLNSTATSMAVSYPALTASDGCGSAAVSSSPASGSVFPVGTTTVNATATDPSQNSSSCHFTVTVLYNFAGFFSPVNNPPILNAVNAGRAVPVKFSLSGNKGPNIFAPNMPASGAIGCTSTDPAVDLTETVTAGGSSLSYDPSNDQYVYVWKTDQSWAGTCRQLVLQLNDGSFYRANFKFK